MKTFTILGRVLPDNYPLPRDLKRTFEWDVPEQGSLARMTVIVEAGHVTVRCQVEDFSKDAFDGAYVRALDATKAMVDVFGFMQGVAYGIVLDKCIEPNGTVRQLVVAHHELAERCRSLSNEDVEEVIDLVLAEPPLFQALSDLMASIAQSHYSPISCGRVVESIARIIAGPDKTGTVMWPPMREALRLDPAYLKFITHHSKGPRHGDRTALSGDVTTELVARTWTMMDRFIAYRRSGNLSLPADKFPTLTG
jgi:hypothetical protein